MTSFHYISIYKIKVIKSRKWFCGLLGQDIESGKSTNNLERKLRLLRSVLHRDGCEIEPEFKYVIFHISFSTQRQKARFCVQTQG